MLEESFIFTWAGWINQGFFVFSLLFLSKFSWRKDLVFFIERYVGHNCSGFCRRLRVESIRRYLTDLV